MVPAPLQPLLALVALLVVTNVKVNAASITLTQGSYTVTR